MNEEQEKKGTRKRRRRGPSHVWTPEQDAFLLKQHGSMPNAVIAELLGVENRAAKRRWRQLAGNGIPWETKTKEEQAKADRIVAFLRNNIDAMTWQQMADETGKTIRELNRIAEKNGIAKTHMINPGAMASDQLLDFIRTNIKTMKWDEMAAATGKRKQTLQKIAKRNGLSKTNRIHLTEEQSEEAAGFLREHIDEMTWDQLQAESGVSKYALMYVARTHGIKKASTEDVYRGKSKAEAVPFLREHINDMTWDELSLATGLTKDQLLRLADRNGIKKSRKSRPIAEPLNPEREQEIIAFLREHVDDMPWTKLAAETGCTVGRLEYMAKRNGIQKTVATRNLPKTDDEVHELEAFLRKNCDLMSWKRLSAVTGMSKSALQRFMDGHGIQKKNTRKARLEEETELTAYLRANVDKLTWKQMAEKTGRNLESLRAYAARRGIAKNGKAVNPRKKDGDG